MGFSAAALGVLRGAWNCLTHLDDFIVQMGICQVHMGILMAGCTGTDNRHFPGQLILVYQDFGGPHSLTDDRITWAAQLDLDEHGFTV